MTTEQCTTPRPRLLDLFCGAGGAADGYRLAGFHVTGIDHVPQPRYRGDTFILADALIYLANHGHEYDVIHASPPCQAYSALRHLATRAHPTLVEPVRDALVPLRKPYVIENVVGAPLRVVITLCGSMFALQTPCGAQLRRHRLFETSHVIFAPGECQHASNTISVMGGTPKAGHRIKIPARTITVTGSTPQRNVVRNTIRETFSVEAARIAMGIDWMTRDELSQAIPPAYTQWIGQQLLHVLGIRHD